MDSLLTFIVISWIILVICYLLSALFFFILVKKSLEDEDRRRIMLLVCFVFLFLALSRLVHVIVIFMHGDLFKTELSSEHELLFSISPILFYSGVITILFSFERRIKKFNRNYFTYILILIAIVHFTFVYLYAFNKTNASIQLFKDFISWIWNIVAGILFVILASMYLKISFKTSGEVMRKALLIFIGFLFLIASYAVFGLEDFGVSRELIGILSVVFGLGTIPFLIFGYK